jgi:uncharacterized membrane protein
VTQTSEETKTSERWLALIFKVGIAFKGIDGVLELVGGLLLLAIPVSKIDAFTRLLTQHELKQDPNDFIAGHVQSFADSLTGSATLFASIYLLAHGLVKVVLVVEVLRGKLRAYPWMIGFLVAFVLYQLYEIATHFTIGLTLLTVFDLLIIWLTWHEYQRKRVKLNAK